MLNPPDRLCTQQRASDLVATLIGIRQIPKEPFRSQKHRKLFKRAAEDNNELVSTADCDGCYYGYYATTKRTTRPRESMPWPIA